MNKTIGDELYDLVQDRFVRSLATASFSLPALLSIISIALEKPISFVVALYLFPISVIFLNSGYLLFFAYKRQEPGVLGAKAKVVPTYPLLRSYAIVGFAVSLILMLPMFSIPQSPFSLQRIMDEWSTATPTITPTVTLTPTITATPTVTLTPKATNTSTVTLIPTVTDFPHSAATATPKPPTPSQVLAYTSTSLPVPIDTPTTAPIPIDTPTLTPADTPTTAPQPECISWEFATDGDTEGWKPGGAGRLRDTTVLNGSLVAHFWHKDPFWEGPDITLDSSSCKELRIRYRIDAPNVAIPIMQFMWKTETSGDVQYWIEFPVVTDNTWNEITIDDLQNESFNWQGIITRLRLDPVKDASNALDGSVEIDYIRVCCSP